MNKVFRCIKCGKSQYIEKVGDNEKNSYYSNYGFQCKDCDYKENKKYKAEDVVWWNKRETLDKRKKSK